MASVIEYAEWNGLRSGQAIILESMNPMEASPIVFYLLAPAERTNTNIERYKDC
jgi:hypothetical protein